MLWIIIIVCLIIIISTAASIGFRKAGFTRHVSAEGIEDEAVIDAYDRISRWPQFKVLRSIILRELIKYQPKGTLADIGCGPGYLITRMVQAMPQLSIIGVDISDKILKKARKNLAKRGLTDRVTFRPGDIKQLPFEPSSLDFAVSTLSLHHWSNPSAALEEIHRVLKPAGQFLIFDLRRDSPRIVYWVLRAAQTLILPRALRRVNEPTSSFLAAYQPSEVQSMLSLSSFKSVDISSSLFWLFAWGQKN